VIKMMDAHGHRAHSLRGIQMSVTRFLPMLAATLCFDAAAHPLDAAVSWMAEAQPFNSASIERHFGVKANTHCAGRPGAFECMATGDKLEAHWRTDVDGGEASEGYLRVPLTGCLHRRDAEKMLGTPLRLDAHSVAERSQTVTLSANHWSPANMWRVGITFDRDCASSMTIATPPR
jgi:hypothetical protein